MEHAGYREIEHTADWALHVWAPTPAALFVLAAAGMYGLAGTEFAPAPWEVINLEISGEDMEDLLVSFLTELLYFGEQSNQGGAKVEIPFLDELGLRAIVHLAPLVSRDKEIKAVTYHNLIINRVGQGCETILVFDV